MWIGIKLPLLPVSIFYCILFSFSLVLVTVFIIITDLILLKLNYFIGTASTCLPLPSSVLWQLSSSSCCISCIGFFFCTICFPCFGVLLHTPSRWFIWPQLLHVLPYAEHNLGWCAIPQYLQHSLFLLCGIPVCLDMFSSSSVKLYFAYHVKFCCPLDSSMAFWDLCSSIHISHNNANFLVTSLQSYDS